MNNIRRTLGGLWLGNPLTRFLTNSKFRHAPRDCLRVIRRHVRQSLSKALIGQDSPIHKYHAQTIEAIEAQTSPILADSNGITTTPIHIQSSHPIFNPGIELIDDRFFLIARCTNIITVNDGDYRYTQPLNCAEEHNTDNYIIELDTEFRISNYHKLNDEELRRPHLAPNGVEDVRLFLQNKRLHGIGAGIARSKSGKTTVSQIVFEIVDNCARNPRQAPMLHGSPQEKNWAPIPAINEQQITFITKLSPLTYINLMDNGFHLPPDQARAAIDFDIRGGTPFIRWGTGYLSIVHNPPVKINGANFYAHRFALIDEEYRIREFSRPFFFQRRGIEFACGLVRSGDFLVVSYGVSDRSSWVMRIPIEKVMRMLGENLGMNYPPTESHSATDMLRNNLTDPVHSFKSDANTNFLHQLS